MALPLKMANVWRVLRDVNLESIRESAEARFALPIVTDEPEDGVRLRALLSPGGETAPHPWLSVVRAQDGVPAMPHRPVVGVLVARHAELSLALATARDAFVRGGVPVITAVVGSDAAAVPEADEVARVVAPAVDSRLARELGSAVLEAAGPAWRLALARQLPCLRHLVITAIVDETAQANASYAFATGMAEVVPVLTAPMNIGDMIVLTKNQLVMSYRIALASGLDGNPRQLIPEILGVLGGGLLLRQVARQLVGLIPVLGIVPKVAVAYGGTQAIGRAIAVWAAEGKAVSSETLQRFSREGLTRGREIAKTLARRSASSAPGDRPRAS